MPRWSRRPSTLANAPVPASPASRSARRSKPPAGEVVTGCNIENATYGLTMCAERVALYKALSEGRDVFTRIAVVADTEDPTPPCGPAGSCCGNTAATSKWSSRTCPW